MDAINYSTFRKNMKKYMDKVNEDMETYIVTRRDHQNVVMMSQEEYDNLMENEHLLGNPANREWLLESKSQYENGQVKEYELLEEDE